MINGGYARQRKVYKNFKASSDVHKAIDWAIYKGISQTGAYWSHLWEELDRLEEIEKWQQPIVSQYYLDQY